MEQIQKEATECKEASGIDNVNEESVNVQLKESPNDFDGVKANTLLKDCRRARPKAKNRPPSAVFLKETILNAQEGVVEVKDDDMVVKDIEEDSKTEVVHKDNDNDNNNNEITLVDSGPVATAEENVNKIKPQSFKTSMMGNPMLLNLLGEMQSKLSSGRVNPKIIVTKKETVVNEKIELRAEVMEKPLWMQELLKRKSFKAAGREIKREDVNQSEKAAEINSETTLPINDFRIK